MLIRYADDAVALCHSRQQAEQVKTRLAEWLTPRGLVFNEDKTKIAHLDETGFDYLGLNVLRYHGKLVLIKPSRAAVRRIRRRLRTELRALRGSNAGGVLKKLTPIVRGWAAWKRKRGTNQWYVYTFIVDRPIRSVKAKIRALTHRVSQADNVGRPLERR